MLHLSGAIFIEDRNGKIASNLAFEKNESYSINDKYIISVIKNINKWKKIVKTYWIGPFVEARVDYNSSRIIGHGEFFINGKSIDIFKDLEKVIDNTISGQQEFDETGYVSLNEWMEFDKNSTTLFE